MAVAVVERVRMERMVTIQVIQGVVETVYNGRVDRELIMGVEVVVVIIKQVREVRGVVAWVAMEVRRLMYLAMG
tara:strand:+ start:705 stop:926 length:222 start_codon:yes stop_codon:yes gene_type:complete